MLFHSTLYEGALERACIDLGVPAFAVSVDTVAVKLATKTVRNRLLDEWKKGQSKPEYGNIKFVSEPPCADGASNELPTMQLCKIVGEGADSVLSVPTDIRQKWLGDPAHAPEWRALLRKFDAKLLLQPLVHKLLLLLQGPICRVIGTTFSRGIPKRFRTWSRSFPELVPPLRSTMVMDWSVMWSKVLNST